MAPFLSPAWIDALDHAARSDADLCAVAPQVDLVVEQVVTDAPGGTVVYHVVIGGDGPAVRPGPAPTATVRFTQDHSTARAIARGELAAQAAFMAGALQVGGDLQALVAHTPEISALGDVFAAVRQETTFADDAPAGA